jgi:hypothetical protein
MRTAHLIFLLGTVAAAAVLSNVEKRGPVCSVCPGEPCLALVVCPEANACCGTKKGDPPCVRMKSGGSVLTCLLRIFGCQEDESMWESC